VADIFGHHIGKVCGTPTGGQLEGNGRMAIVDGEGADKPQLENRLVQFGIQHVPEPLQEGWAIVARGKFALHFLGHRLFTSIAFLVLPNARRELRLEAVRSTPLLG
jgi:hypothetical protein